MDIGASVSIISESLVPTEKNFVSIRKVFDANRNAIKIVGETKVKLIVNKRRLFPTSFTANFVVIRNNILDKQLLLSMNILKYVTLDFAKRTMTFKNNDSSDYQCKSVKLEVLTQVMNIKDHHVGDRISALIDKAQSIDRVSNTEKMHELRDPLLSAKVVNCQGDSCDENSLKEKLQELRDPLLSEKTVNCQSDS